MNEFNFENCKREMAIIDWLCEKRFMRNRAIAIVNYMMTEGCGISEAILKMYERLESEDEKESLPVYLNFQPNCS